MIFITKALEQLGVDGFILSDNPTTEAEFQQYFSKIVGEDSNGNAILSKEFPVTWVQVTTKAEELQLEYDNKEYQRNRAAEYPSYADQFDTIFHEGVDAWKAQIQVVKDKYPKV